MSQRLLLPWGGVTMLSDGSGVDLCDHRHILRTLHTTFDLGAGYPHLLQLLQMLGQRHIFQGEQRFVRCLSPTVVQAAGLGAHAPVAAAAADDGGEEALTGVAHTQGAVDEALDLHWGAVAQIGDLVSAQLPAHHHPGHAQVGGGFGPVQGVDGHLGAGVEGQVRRHLAAHPRHAQVLHQQGVHAHLADLIHQLGGLGQLPVVEEGVEGEIDLDPAEVAVLDGLLEGGFVEVDCVAAVVEVAIAQVDGVSTALDGGADGLWGTGGG